MDDTVHLGIEPGQRILAISPHPDDAELGCGGTLSRLSRLGHEVDLAVVTDGRLGTRDSDTSPDEVAVRRAREQASAASVIGARLHMLSLPDGGPHDHYALRDIAVGLLRELRPQWVFVCDPWLPYEAHSDHRVIGYAVAEAALLSDLPHYAPGPVPPHAVEGVIFYFPARPTTLVALTDADAERRRAAIACHESQFKPGDAYLQRLDRQMEIDGAAEGSRLAERLHVRRRRELHIPVE